MAKNIRADQLLVAQGLAESVARAQALILAGAAYVGEKKIQKAGDLVRAATTLTVRGKPHPWVSRGGLKLDHGLTHFKWDINGAIVVDIGASTGGFTDVALHRGAAKIYAVDVGHGQLAWKLQTDPRVVVLDKTNARHLTPDDISGPIDLVVCDASFISLKSVLPASMALTRPQARLLALIKPQFEADKADVGTGGIVRDPQIHQEICDDVCAWMASQSGWQVAGITPSPITGPDGNIEFLMAAEKIT
jgi:23S rRNA (cytidine1920-2'-O)/16S rRNA (cytidine1409-2'-O)-methyltransferase